MPEIVQSKRITSIDALRAFTLLGILFVHSTAAFGFGGDIFIPTEVGNLLRKAAKMFFSDRFATIFNILFGCSFYLILRKPNYPRIKFVWRCFLLMCFGLLAKKFYTFDVLLWYGIWGIVLVLFKNFNTKQLFISFILFFVLARIIDDYGIGTKLFGIVDQRYHATDDLTDILQDPLKESIKDYFTIVFNGGIFGCLAKMILGYWIAKKGFLERINDFAKIKYFIYFAAPYLVLMIIQEIFEIEVIKDIAYLFGSFSYAILFLIIYNKFEDKLFWMASYGRLGLTNYFMQGVVGVSLIPLLDIPHRMTRLEAVGIMLLFYALQNIFSYYWLKFFKFGPMEYLWRSLTDFKFKSMKK